MLPPPQSVRRSAPLEAREPFRRVAGGDRRGARGHRQRGFQSQRHVLGRPYRVGRCSAISRRRTTTGTSFLLKRERITSPGFVSPTASG